jgi:Protein of unknown function (DUF3224)
VIGVDRKILLTVLALAAVLSVTPYIGTVHATKPTSFVFTCYPYHADLVDYRQAGKSGNWIYDIVVDSTLTGDITGTDVAHNHWIVHSDGSLNIQLECTSTIDSFMGKSVSGTLNYKLDGSGDASGSEGTWVIISGTGDLANLRGQGTFTGTLVAVEYTGQIHFDP